MAPFPCVSSTVNLIAGSMLLMQSRNTCLWACCLKEKYGLEVLHLLQLWEKSVIRECHYRNYRIFTLRYISKDLVLVSVRLRSACSKISQGARKIIEKAKKQLLQDRVKCINRTIEATINTINNSRSRLACIVTNTTELDKCSRSINAVREDRYGKVKDRQVRKYNILISTNNKNNYNQSNSNSNNLAQVSNTDSVGSNNNQLQTINKNIWVINLSKNRLTEGQKAVLAKGPNFSIAPKNISNMDYITAVESMCPKLKEEHAMELRAEVNSLLRNAQVPKPNLTKQERLGLAQLKKDKDRVILTADRGVAMVVMDNEEYVTKVQELLSQPVYRLLPRDPTNKIKAQLITKLRKIKKENNLDEGMYKAMYPTGCIPPSFMGYQKFINRQSSQASSFK